MWGNLKPRTETKHCHAALLQLERQQEIIFCWKPWAGIEVSIVGQGPLNTFLSVLSVHNYGVSCGGDGWLHHKTGSWGTPRWLHHMEARRTFWPLPSQCHCSNSRQAVCNCIGGAVVSCLGSSCFRALQWSSILPATDAENSGTLLILSSLFGRRHCFQSNVSQTFRALTPIVCWTVGQRIF